MTRPISCALSGRLLAGALSLMLSVASGVAAAAPETTEQQRSTAQKVSSAGVPLSELAANAPDSYTVKSGDTLWGISGLFLQRPWRWPELWGMNLEQIRNPHLIFPGQLLSLDTSSGRARLRVGTPISSSSTVARLSPQVRASKLDATAIASIPFNLIEPFLNEAVIFEVDALKGAPRIVAAQEGRVLLSKGDTAYVRGDRGGNTAFRIFRQARPLTDPATREVLGFEAPFVGTAELVRKGDSQGQAAGQGEVVPDTFLVTSIRQEAGVGDRLAPVVAHEYENYAPHAPQNEVSGQIVSIYGDALTAGQSQIVVLNRGAGDGLERGHVLALWRDGRRQVDATDGQRTLMKLPDERNGLLMVFKTFDRLSYALIIEITDSARVGDRLVNPR